MKTLINRIATGSGNRTRQSLEALVVHRDQRDQADVALREGFARLKGQLPDEEIAALEKALFSANGASRINGKRRTNGHEPTSNGHKGTNGRSKAGGWKGGDGKRTKLLLAYLSRRVGKEVSVPQVREHLHDKGYAPEKTKFVYMTMSGLAAKGFLESRGEGVHLVVKSPK